MIYPPLLVTYPFSAEIEVKTMGWLQFIESMTGHLAWPVVILIVIFAVRKHLGSLAERILELSFGGATVKFDKLLTKGAVLIEQTEEREPHEAAEEVAKSLNKHLERLKEIRSREADEGQALMLFRDMELKLVEIGTALALTPEKGRLLAREVVDHLRRSKRIDFGLSQLFYTLQEGRNLLAHARKLNQTEIDEYVRQASFFSIQLDVLKERIDKEGKG